MSKEGPRTPVGATDSQQLLTRAQAGDHNSLERLVARYLPQLRRWAHRRLPGWARTAFDTGDLVQETLLHTLRRLAFFRPQQQGALLRYLRKGLANRVRDQVRRAGRRPFHAELDEQRAGFGNSPLQTAIERENGERYRRALQRLRPADRNAIVARLELGYSYEQLALALDKPTAEAARLAVRRALLRLADEMRGE